MQKATAITIDSIIKSLLNKGNGDVYDTRLNTTDRYRIVPYVIYFYYIKFLDDGQPWVRHYRYTESSPISVAQLGIKIKDLALKVRNGDDASSEPFMEIGKNFQEIKWRHKCYIVIFMDSPYWKLLKRISDPTRSAVVFNTNKGGKPNHTFFDADDLKIDMPPAVPPIPGDSKERSAVYFINHMKKTDFGDDLGYDQNGKKVDEEEKFAFDVYFDVSDDSTGPSTVFIIDPDGTNMGPPQSPP
ncbi:MAG: hypothetical protein QOH47_1538 [Sphingomonadales bacterium]|jgi:hypothetical protein|nr:hypothetical protein [Sphingomonadales bacterium]